MKMSFKSWEKVGEEIFPRQQQLYINKVNRQFVQLKVPNLRQTNTEMN